MNNSPENQWQDRTPAERDDINFAENILSHCDEKIKMQKELNVPPVPDELKELLRKQNVKPNNIVPLLWKVGAIAAMLFLVATFLPKKSQTDLRTTRGGSVISTPHAVSTYVIGNDEQYKNFSSMRSEKEMIHSVDFAAALDGAKNNARSLIVDFTQKKIYVLEKEIVIKEASLESDDALDASLRVDQIQQD